MRHLTSLVIVALLGGAVGAAATQAPRLITHFSGTQTAKTAPAGFWQTPTIEGYGKIHYLPESAYLPRTDKVHKIVFQITEQADAPDKVNKELDHLARTVNLYVAAGVPLSQLKFVGAISGAATDAILSNEHYHEVFGIKNPNAALIEQLTRAGVDLAVCSQAVAGHHYPYDAIDPHVTLALSSLTTITSLEEDGYVLMPL
ncbi:sulfur reduction protein DsrE [Chimaeribacter arupi]|jgi:intracellular sulfur oxidation DsrE/DsrF family protein|uniref:Sulfur reduction protein DsrE n=2 Tax=Yersiniaceae TaxID=1903411 RepID=A0A2N5EMK1_9GAMM|nr:MULTISPECIES: DsrE family protein [Yersiniaceae]MBS0968626.1 DsrE family protein [Nissabacter archeti]MDV5139753.1 DsrE family protein [Chimaeribacter arupi]PLR33545.1 sulfur reduction protein DsrE [Chimaeribacter arupi]PLR46654.1 sulfur reduction protein DsrE [Chimaeribacter arupi]PLR49295.1 sulfur reduction protein DsrE [Chimaeribacter arupi]